MTEFFNHPKILEHVDHDTLLIYEKLSLVQSFQIFCQKIYKIVNHTYGNTYEDQIIMILLIKYYWGVQTLEQY